MEGYRKYYLNRLYKSEELNASDKSQLTEILSSCPRSEGMEIFDNHVFLKYSEFNDKIKKVFNDILENDARNPGGGARKWEKESFYYENVDKENGIRDCVKSNIVKKAHWSYPRGNWSV